MSGSATSMVPHDLTMEATVLSVLLIDPTAYAKVSNAGGVDLFYSESHRRTFEAIEALSRERREVDVATVGCWLRDHERLEQVGGMSALTEILTVAPGVHNVDSYARTLAEKAALRSLIVETENIAANVRLGNYSDTASAIENASARISAISERVSSANDNNGTGVEFLTFEDIFTPEPQAKLIVPHLGIAPGPANGVVGESHVGKSLVALSLGLSVASGKDLWGVYSVQHGRWLHLDHEQGKRHSKRYITRLMRGMGIDKEDIRGRFEIAVYPRLNLTTKNAEDVYTRLFTGFDLVTLDALRGLIPGVDENSSLVRDNIDILGRASEKTGCAVILIHHAGKPSLGKQRKHSARGSSGIRDSFQSEFILTGNKGEPIHVSHEKTRELGTPVDDFHLRIVNATNADDPNWGVRVEYVAREELTPKEDPLAALKGSIIKVVRGSRFELKTKNSIVERVSGGSKGKRILAFDELVQNGKIVDVGGVFKCP